MQFFKRRVPVLIPVALALCVALAPAGHALGKKKKKVDLSANPLASVNSKQPDKELFDKAMRAMQKGKYDIARLDLQTLLNTYTDSEYAMRAKLAVGDTWYKEGGTAAMAQAEQEYKDFITFFPNTPEAAEAQMKVGDIYYSQMDKPDRDPANAEQAETAYRQMLQQFPDSSLVPRAKQRLREVQQVLAQRQFEIGEFYLSHNNWPASIARLTTVADNYPLFSAADQTLISIGDAYAQEASLVQGMNIPPKAKAELVRAYDNRAAQAWDRVVTRYPMAPHVEDARDRLIAMGRQVPTPTAAEMAESEAEEGSRAQVHLKDRALLTFAHGPDTITSARVGEPTMTDASPVLAPAVIDQTTKNFNLAMKGDPLAPPSPLGPPAAQVAEAVDTSAPGAVEAAQPAPTMENVPEGNGSDVGAEIVNEPNSAPAAAAPSADGTTGGTASEPTPGSAPNGGPGTTSAVTPNTSPGSSTAGAPAANPAANGNVVNPFAQYGLAEPVGPNTPAPLPPVDKPAAAPDQINDVKAGSQPQVYTGTTAGAKPGKKNPKPAYHAGDESSSKHHKKKGVDKINPF